LWWSLTSTRTPVGSLRDLEANVAVGVEHGVGDELVGEQDGDLDQLNALPMK